MYIRRAEGECSDTSADDSSISAWTSAARRDSWVWANEGISIDGMLCCGKVFCFYYASDCRKPVLE